MNTTHLTRVRALFNSEYVPRHINRANQRKWVQSVRTLGINWLLHQPVQHRFKSRSVESV